MLLHHAPPSASARPPGSVPLNSPTAAGSGSASGAGCCSTPARTTRESGARPPWRGRSRTPAAAPPGPRRRSRPCARWRRSGRARRPPGSTPRGARPRRGRCRPTIARRYGGRDGGVVDEAVIAVQLEGPAARLHDAADANGCLLARPHVACARAGTPPPRPPVRPARGGSRHPPPRGRGASSRRAAPVGGCRPAVPPPTSAAVSRQRGRRPRTA